MLISPVERLAFEALTTRREAPCEVASGRRGDQLIFCQLLADESGEATCFSARAWRLDLDGGDPDFSGLSLGVMGPTKGPLCPSPCDSSLWVLSWLP